MCGPWWISFANSNPERKGRSGAAPIFEGPADSISRRESVLREFNGSKLVAIIGGGISGLSAAYYLSKAGIPAILFEKAPRLGGVIETQLVEGCLVEGGPDSFLSAKPAALELIRELGLESEVIGSNDHLRVTYIVRNGKLVPMPDGLMMMIPTKIWPMLTTSIVGWGTKIKMGLEFFRKPGPMAERSVGAMIRDHYGQETVDYLAEPLLAGVYGGDPEQLSAEAVLGQFVELEKKYGSLTKGTLARRAAAPKTAAGGAGTLFRTMKGGLGTLTSAIEKAIEGKVETRHEAVTSVAKAEDGGYLINGWQAVSKVIVCTPAWQAAELLRGLSPTAADGLAAIGYNSSVTLGLIYNRTDIQHPLNGFGFLVPAKERKRMAACTWVGTKFSYRVPEDKVLLRCFVGGANSNGISDAQLIEDVRAELRDYMGVTATPKATNLVRWNRAMAQYTVGHKGRIDAIVEALKPFPGLHLAGNAYEGIGIPDCIRMGKTAAEKCR